MSIDIVCGCGWKTTTDNESSAEPARCPVCGGLPLIQGAIDLEGVATAGLMEIEPAAPRKDQPTEEELGPAEGEYAITETAEPIRAAIPSRPRRVVLRKRPEISRFAGLQIPVHIDAWGSIGLALVLEQARFSRFVHGTK
jgi:hypothetical protein